MVHIEETIDIQASPEAVFAVISDLCRRARLNPHWKILECEPLDGPMRAGSRYRFVSRRNDTVTRHVSRVAVYDPPCRLVLKSEVHPDLQIELTVGAAAGGARLTHVESFNAVPAKPTAPEQPLGFLGILRQWLMLEQEGYADVTAAENRKAMQEQIQTEIRAWLVAIKQATEHDATT